MHYATVFAQNDFVEMRFEINHPKLLYNHFEIRVFCKERQYFAKISSLSSHLKTKIIDTIYIISKEEFDNLVEKAFSISSNDLLQSINNQPGLFNDGIGCKLSINVFQQKMEYSIVSPMTNTAKRNLITYLYVFKEALLLSKLNPNKILK